MKLGELFLEGARSEVPHPDRAVKVARIDEGPVLTSAA